MAPVRAKTHVFASLKLISGRVQMKGCFDGALQTPRVVVSALRLWGPLSASPQNKGMKQQLLCRRPLLRIPAKQVGQS